MGAAATKCLVCGADLSAKTAKPASARLRPSGAPAAGWRLPIPLLIIVLLLLGVGGVVAYMFTSHRVNLPTAAPPATGTPTGTRTAPPTFTFTPTSTETPAPTATPLPPMQYKVVAGDTCVAIAAAHNVSSQSIIALNHLDPNCNLSVGRQLLIPQPTATPSPLPTATLGAVVATQAQRTTYTVHAGDTLAGIAKFYGVSVVDLMQVNGLPDTNITTGQVLVIPLDKVITPGPSPTPTPPAPWPAPNLLLPADGQTFNAADTVTLQWTSVGTLRTGESYYVAVEDVTCNCARLYKLATTETKLIVPATFRHSDKSIHVYRWTVTTVRQTNADNAQPQYESAGATSPIRDFTWAGGNATPAP